MVYLLHFDRAFSHARHYVGAAESAEHLSQILSSPRDYTRSPMLHAAAAAGIGFHVARTWPGDYRGVVRLRATGNLARYCSICRAAGRGDTSTPVRTVRLGGGGTNERQ